MKNNFTIIFQEDQKGESVGVAIYHDIFARSNRIAVSGKSDTDISKSAGEMVSHLIKAIRMDASAYYQNKK